jgi:anti-sigma factor RsiW
MSEHCDIEQTLIERFHDGELPPTERARLERHLADCADCRRRLQALRLGGELLGEHLQRAVETADFGGFEQRVLAGIAERGPGSPLERLGLWLRESLVHHRAAWLASAAAAAAVLLLALWLLPGGTRPDRSDPAPATLDSSAAPEQPRVAAGTGEAPADNDVIIDSLEYAGKRSMIFTVSKNNTTVIWMVDFDRAGAVDKRGDEI